MNEYPPLIYLDDETKQELSIYLDQQLLTHYAERSTFVQDLIDWQKAYWARPATKQRTFPFKGASNIIIPLIAIATETIHAKEMQTLFGLDQFVTVKLVDEFSQLDHALENYLNWETLKGMKFREKIQGPILEKLKFGTGIAKVSWNRVVKTAMIDDKEVDIVTSQGNDLEYVPLANFLMPFTAQDPQTAPWCGEEHIGNKYQIESYTRSGLFYPDTMDKLKGWLATATNTLSLSSNNFRVEKEREMDQQPAWPQWIGWTEIYLDWNVDRNTQGKKREIVVHYHRLSREFMAVRYNWYSDLRRPYRKVNHFNIEGRWNGIGVAKQSDNFQSEITTQHRQRLDNATIANVRMFKVKRLATNITPGEAIFPGKLWFVDDMTDVESIQLGDVYASSFNNEQQSLYYEQQRVGVNELNTGMSQVGTPGTASSDLARLQESSRKFDYSFANTKTFVNELLIDCVCNINQFGHRNIKYFDFIPEGNAIISFFNLPIDLIKDGIVANIQVIGSQENKLVDRNNWTQLAGITQQYFTQMIQLAEMSGNKELMNLFVIKSMMAGSEVYKQLLESFDVRNIDRITLNETLNGIYKQATGAGNPGVTQLPTQPGGQIPASLPSGVIPEGATPNVISGQSVQGNQATG
jgi:hypothetical protein